MSTKRKKKIESEKVSPLTNKGYRLSFNPDMVGHYRRGRNPLDDELESEDAMLARESKTMRVEAMNLKRKAKMVKLQKEIDKLEKEGEKMDSDDSDMPRISIAMAQQIANLPPREREKVIETYAMFRSIDQSKGKGDSLLPLLIGFSKTNPGTQQSDMATYAKAMSDQFKTGIDAMKAVMPAKDKASNPMEFMKVMKDLVIEGVRNPLLQAIEKSQPQPGIIEQFITNPDLFNRVKELGMFGREPRTGSTNIDLEIEKLRGERELSITKLNLEMRKSILEMEAKDRRSDNILALAAPISALLAGPVTQRMQQLGEQQGAAHLPPNVNPRVAPPTGTTILLRCACGYEGPKTFPGPPPPIIQCPGCGQDLLVGGAPGDGKPEKADSGT